MEEIEMHSDSESHSSKNAPDFITKLRPRYICIAQWHEDDGRSFRRVRFGWESIGELELNIGPPEMEKPWVANKHTLTLAPGAYLYNLAM